MATMMKSAILRSCSTPILMEAEDLHRTSTTRIRSSSAICCSTTRSNTYIPKLQPFSRSKLERVLKDPPLIEKSENDLTDYCSTLEGDDSYSCWRAYFELKDLERQTPKEDVEKLILQAGGTKSLIGVLHGITPIHKEKADNVNSSKPVDVKKRANVHSHIPDGLPKSSEEMEEEEKGRMPDSAYTRLLRTKGTSPAWYSRAPDHETD